MSDTKSKSSILQEYEQRARKMVPVVVNQKSPKIYFQQGKSLFAFLRYIENL